MQPAITRSQTTAVNLSWVEITTSGSLSQNDKHPKFHRRPNRRLTAFNLFTAALRFRKSPLPPLKWGEKRRRRRKTSSSGTSESFFPSSRAERPSAWCNLTSCCCLAAAENFPLFFYVRVHVCQHIKHEFSFIRPSIFFSSLRPLHWSKYSHIKGPTEVREYKARAQSLLYIWRTASVLDGSALNPTLTAGLSFISWWFEPERNREERKKKISNRLGQVNFLALSTHFTSASPITTITDQYHQHHLSLWPSRLLASRGSLWGKKKRESSEANDFPLICWDTSHISTLLSTLDVLQRCCTSAR